MKTRPYLLISAVVFAVVALLHLARLLRSVDVLFGDYHVPMTGSVIGLLIAAALSIWGFSLARK